MKNNISIKQTVTTVFLFFTLLIYSQITVNLENIKYLGQTISNCGTINFNSNNYHDILFDLKVERPYYANDPDLYAYGNLLVAYWTGSGEVIKLNISIDSSSWTYVTSSNTAFINLPRGITLNSIDFDNSNGGSLYARYEESNGFMQESCDIDITKPKFRLSPSSTTVSCGSTGKTFTVINENNSPGNLSYQWSIGSGWEYNGNAVSNFTTSTNTVTLVPTSFPPSNVQVTPKLDGVSVLPQLTTTISLSSYNPSYTITGDDSLCDSATYAINGLPSGTTITSWSSSNTAIATVSATNNYQAVVTKVSDGSVTISATAQNSCGQTAPFTKNINIGAPSFASVYITGNSTICSNQTKTYSVNIPSHPCIGTINWTVSPNIEIISQNYNTITVAPSTTNLENAGFISVSIPNANFESTKGVWVGLPSNTNGLTIQKIGSYNLYTGQWTKLKANYSVVVYDVNEPFNVTFEWLIPNSQVRNFNDSAYKDVKPYSSGQLNIGVKAINECGCGDWKYRLFDVLPSGTGGGVELISIE